MQVYGSGIRRRGGIATHFDSVHEELRRDDLPLVPPRRPTGTHDTASNESLELRLHEGWLPQVQGLALANLLHHVQVAHVQRLQVARGEPEGGA